MILLALSVASLASPAATAQDFPGWDFCVSPVEPRCVAADETYTTETKQTACQAAVDAYVARYLKYRMCLVHQILRASRAADSLKQRFKCGIERKAACSEDESSRN